RLIIGGGMCFTFLAAQGHDVGGSLLQEDMIDTCKDLLERFGDVIVLPTDVVAAESFAKDASTRPWAFPRFRPAGWAWISARSPQPRSLRCSAKRRPSSGTAQWGSSSSRRSPLARRRSPRPSLRPPTPVPSPWSVAATPLPLCAPWDWTRRASATSPPEVVPPWSSWRARPCRASRYWVSPKYRAATRRFPAPGPGAGEV